MNTLLKEKINVLKTEISKIEGELELAKHKTKVQKEYIDTLESDKAKKLKDLEEQINDIQTAIDEAENEIKSRETEKLELGDPKKEQRELDQHRREFSNQILQAERELTFYEDHDDCPTCKQDIPHEHKERVKEGKSKEIQDLTKATKGLDKKYKEVTDTLEKYIDISDQISEIQSEMITQERYRNTLQNDLNSAKENRGNIDEETKKLKFMAEMSWTKMILGLIKMKNNSSITSHQFFSKIRVLKPESFVSIYQQSISW